MSFIDRDDLYKNYLHPDNWMTPEKVEDRLNTGAPEMESDEQLEDLEFN